MSTASSSLSHDDLAAGVAVAKAGRDAAEGAPNAEAARLATRLAIKAKATDVGMNLSDGDINALSDAVVDKIEACGGFDETEKVPAPAGAAAPESGPVKQQSWAERRLRVS